MTDLIGIASGPWTAAIAPSNGGAICALTWKGWPILRPMSARAIRSGDVNGAAAYPLAPYGNRIAARRFSFGGVAHALAKTAPGGPHSLHGVGWRRAWTVDAADAATCALTLRHRPAQSGAEDWPFAFDARQRFSLTEDGLTVAMAVTNAGPTDAPAGLGLHPFFPRRPGQRLAFRCAGAWRNGPDMLPAARVRGGRWDFAAGRALDGAEVDNDFVGWDGLARMTAASGPSVVMRASSAFRVLRVFSPTGADFFAVEPVSHRANAINHPRARKAAMAILAPGASLRGEVRILVDEPR